MACLQRCLVGTIPFSVAPLICILGSLADSSTMGNVQIVLLVMMILAFSKAIVQTGYAMIQLSRPSTLSYYYCGGLLFGAALVAAGDLWILVQSSSDQVNLLFNANVGLVASSLDGFMLLSIILHSRHTPVVSLVPSSGTRLSVNSSFASRSF
jgi:hypothetical protein